MFYKLLYDYYTIEITWQWKLMFGSTKTCKKEK
jgi:hypothetical protein